jgi:hypothetical protein
MATQLYTIDRPDRFYDFNTTDEEISKALGQIDRDIAIINEHKHLIDRTLDSVYDQNTLNYLHNIFEVYHGLLDAQNSTEYWISAPDHVRYALADLNIDVHRCEHISRRGNTPAPRFVSTWYGLPKTHYYEDTDYHLFTNKYTFGTVYLSYCEIGKTLEDLCKDRELDEHQYASADAFNPFNLFSADFNVKLFDVKTDEANDLTSTMWNCYDEHSEFFRNRGYNKYDNRLSNGLLPVADISTTLSNSEVIHLLKTHQYVNKVMVIK